MLHRDLLSSLAVVALHLAAASPVPALTINLTYDTAGQMGSVPAGDSNGALLMAICQTAANYWENIIEDSHTLNLQVRYDDSINGIGKWTESSESGGRATAGAISFKGTTAWYYDPTPNDHDEYGLQQTLVRDLTNAVLLQTCGGSPPPLLEFSFTGAAVATAPAAAQNNTDLYSVALHEICHALGMSSQLSTCATETTDNDYDVFPNLVNGATFDVAVNTTGGRHTICSQCLMTPAIGSGLRRLPSATDVLALSTCPDPGWTDLDLPRQDFLPGGTTVWNTAGNWLGNQVPGALDDVAVRIGKQAGVAGGVTISLSANASCSNFLLGESTKLETNGNRLDVGATATLAYDGSGPKPQIFVESGGEFETGNLVLDGGELDMTGGLADINGDVTLSADTNGEPGEITGFGIVDVAGTLVNNGRITATDLVTNTLTFFSNSSSAWDLDGQQNEGEILATFGNLTFNGSHLDTSFNGLIEISDPFTLTISDPWNFAIGARMDLNGGQLESAKLAGGLITCGGGEIECGQRCLVSAPVDIRSSSFQLTLLGGARVEMDGQATIRRGTVLIGNNAVLDFDNTTTFEGGSYILTEGATIRTDGAAEINGGEFDIGTNAIVELAALHALNGGTFTGNGTLYFGGPTFINDPVTIDCATLDLDGNEQSGKDVTLNDDLTVNSSSLDSNGTTNTFNGTLNFGSSSGLQSAELTILGVPSWTMDGTVNFETDSTLTLPSISGVPFTMSGEAHLDGSTRWEAIATISGLVSIPAADHTLALAGGSAADPNRLLNGFIRGPGRFRATGTANLVGHGIIDAPIDFLGSDSPGGQETRLLASGGTLLLTDPFINVPEVIGTADPTGILRVHTPWTVTSNDTLLLQDGSLLGDTLTNEGHITGFGTLAPDELHNNGEIAARGGRLVIDPTEPCNLDGLDVSPTLAQHRVDATAGSITINGPLLDAFDGTMIIGAGHDLTIPAPWELGINGVLHMNGGDIPGTPASIVGNGTVLRGALLADGECVLQSQATFAAGGTTTLSDASATLRLLTAGIVESGASLTGPGRLVAMPGSFLGLSDGASVGVPVVNEGTLVLIASPARATIAHYTQSAGGRMTFVLAGRPGTGDFDLLKVPGPTDLDGRLSILFNVPDAQPGDTWKIVDTPALSGVFATFDVTGLPAGLGLVKREQSDGVYLELVVVDGTYAEWAAAENIPAGSRAIDDDPENDLIENGLELFLGGDPNAPDTGLLPEPEVLDIDGTEYLSLTVVLANTFTPSDLTFRVIRSTDGVNWSTANVVVEDSSTDPGSGAETRVYRSAFPYASLPKEFLRLEAGP